MHKLPHKDSTSSGKGVPMAAGAKPLFRPDLRALQCETGAWFTAEALRLRLRPAGSITEKLALDWLGKGGKRWRPLLVLGVYRALAGPRLATPESVKNLAVAVECFHKASLVHDDIEDADDMRYDAPTLHRQYGLAVAINIGDLLIGEGYRLIAASSATAAQVRELSRVAAKGHCMLCRGQGDELQLRQHPDISPAPAAVLDIFRHKTAPAFEVALQLGAICARADKATRAALTEFSAALGVAYQIRDDLADLAADHPAAPAAAARPSLLLALANEELARDAFSRRAPASEMIRRSRAEQRTRQWLADYRDEALRALRPLRQPVLKQLLRRLTTLIVGRASPSPNKISTRHLF